MITSVMKEFSQRLFCHQQFSLDADEVEESRQLELMQRDDSLKNPQQLLLPEFGKDL